MIQDRSTNVKKIKKNNPFAVSTVVKQRVS